MKIWVFILLIMVGMEASAGDSISSAVYDLKITDENIEGFCLIKGDDVWEMEFSSWSIEEKKKNMVILKLASNLSDHEVEIPLLRFPHRVEKTLVVVSTRKKFVWKVDSSFYSLSKDDRFLVEDEMERNAIVELDEELKNLRRILRLSEPSYLSENRIYLKEIDAGEEVIVNAWVGRGYEYSLPHIGGAAILCTLLFAVFYFMSKRLG